MSSATYLAGDFSGIQRYVLGVKSAGKAQAKRLRARSFLIELLEHAALETIRQRLCVAEKDILVRGGGGFLLKIPPAAPGELEEISSDLQRKVWNETGGEIQMSLAWADDPLGAHARLECEKHRPGNSLLQVDGSWSLTASSLPPVDELCEVCRQAPGKRRVTEEGGDVLHCTSCLSARSLGEKLTTWKWMRPGPGPVHVLGVSFEPVNGGGVGEGFHAGRWIPRSRSGEPLTFEEIAGTTTGDRRLAVLKADVDYMGIRVGDIIRKDRSYNDLRSFSRDLHVFFGETIHDLLERDWPLIYTLYAGGDDLLLVGPWNTVLDFVQSLVERFGADPGRKYSPLTLSAGIALSPYRIPIRHAVDRAEKLLEVAKRRPGKNRCATLGTVWSWERHQFVVNNGKQLMTWVVCGVTHRSFLRRLLSLLESRNPTDRQLRAARWSYQIQRNVDRRHNDVRHWAGKVLEYLETDEQRVNELAASLRYALLATRTGRERRDG